MTRRKRKFGHGELTADAQALGVSASHLRNVLLGNRKSDRLISRYAKLKDEQKVQINK